MEEYERLASDVSLDSSVPKWNSFLIGCLFNTVAGMDSSHDAMVELSPNG